jgi:putative (di)nucleoside polyphosphate hydrolase
MSHPLAPKNLRPNVCILLYNSQGQLFLGERLGKRGHWQFPQGGVEPEQTLTDTVVRELREEIGVKKRHLGRIRRLKARHSYLWKSIPAYAEGKWIGQAQTFWLVEFIGRDSDIDLSDSKEPEFKRWRWVSVTQVRALAAPERRAGYRAALTEFLALKRAKAL